MQATAQEHWSQPEEGGSFPGPSKSTSGLELFPDVDTTPWTGPLPESFLASHLEPDMVSFMLQGQKHHLPEGSSGQTPTLDHVAEFASMTMHNIFRPQLEDGLGFLDTAGVPLQATPVGHSCEDPKETYWSPPSSSSRQIGNPHEGTDDSCRKGRKRKYEDTKNQEEVYRKQYKRTFVNN